MRAGIDAPPWLLRLAPVAIVGAFALGMIAILTTGHIRLIGISLAGTAFLVAAFLSGNLRLACLWGLILTLPLSVGLRFSQHLDRGGGETAIRIELCELFVLALLGMLIYDVCTGAIPRVRVPKFLIFWIAIMLMGTATAAMGDFRWVAGIEVIRMFKVLVLFLVICNELRRRRQIFHAAMAIVVSMMIQALIGVLQYVRGANLGLEILGESPPDTTQILAETSIYGQEVWRVSGLVMHPNLFGIFLGALLPLSIGLFLVRDRGVARLLYLTATAAGMISLVATYSRSAWISFTVAIGVMLALLVSHTELRRRILVPTVLAIICLTALSALFTDRIASRLFESKIQATTGRELFKQDARNLIGERPLFGFGLNSYVDVVLEYSDFTRRTYPEWIPPVHHIYYLWWAETGIIGLLLHLAVVASIVLIALTNLRLRDPTMLTINVACLVGILAFMIDGFLSFPLRTSPLLRLFWLLAGIIVALYYWRLSSARGDAQPESPHDLTPSAVSRFGGNEPWRPDQT